MALSMIAGVSSSPTSTGMTWSSLFYNTNLNVIHVGGNNGGSYGCNAYSGDTS